MKRFQKAFFALAMVVAFGWMGTTNAFAQASCTANSVPTLVRTAGLTELTGTIVLSTCQGSIPAGGANITITIQPGAAVITNSTAAGFIPTAIITELAPGPALAFVGPIIGSVSGNTVTFAIPATTAGNSLLAVQIGVVPGAAPPFSLSVGIRVNVNASGVVFPGQIGALLTSSPAGILAITNNFLNVAIPQPGLAVNFTPGAGIAQCAARSFSTAPATATYTAITSNATAAAVVYTGGTATAPSVAVVRVDEGFSSAFLVAGAPAAGNGEGADTSAQGTRILFRITDLPTNVVVYAPQSVTGFGSSATLTLTLVPGANSSGNGGTVLAAPVALTSNLLSGSTVTYEVTANSTATAERVHVPFGIFTTGTPGAGTATISAALAPISTEGTAVVIATAPIPRFADVPFSGTLTSVIRCVTNILFTFVTNQQGFDTGFAIANTTTDIFGTSSQSGACVYSFFGQNAPSGGTFTTPAFGGGTTDTRLLSVIAPNFQGYVIAQCNFQLGHGFFITVNGAGGGAVTVTQGSLALILPQPISPTTRAGLASVITPTAGGGVTNFGEPLGH